MLAGRPKSPGCHVHVVTLKESVPSAICLQAGGKKSQCQRTWRRYYGRGPKMLGLVIQNISCQMTLRVSIA